MQLVSLSGSLCKRNTNTWNSTPNSNRNALNSPTWRVLYNQYMVLALIMLLLLLLLMLLLLLLLLYNQYMVLALIVIIIAVLEMHAFTQGTNPPVGLPPP